MEPESGQTLESKRLELVALGLEMDSYNSLLGQVEQNLQVVKQCSSSLISYFQGH